MTDIEAYVDGLFRGRRMTPDMAQLREEILSNMLARRDDLIAQGMSAERASEAAMEGLTDISCLVDDAQLTDMGRYHYECLRSVLIGCIAYWICSMPLMFTGYALFSYAGLISVIAVGCACIARRGRHADEAAFVSVAQSRRRGRLAWAIWGAFFAMAVLTAAALTLGSDIWFGRPLDISGPYQAANVAMRLYLPLITIIAPITVGSFSGTLLRCRKER